jgi:hypothetical protein
MAYTNPIYSPVVGPTPKFTVPQYSYTGGSAPTFNAPRVASVPKYSREYRELPTYEAPEWNQGEIDTLSQQRAAPGLRVLRQQVNRISGENYDNPSLKRMTLREALSGFGTGVSSVMGTANQTAANEYGAKYSRESANSLNEYQSQAAKDTAYNAYQEDVATKGFQGSMAQWQAQNDANMKVAEMDYGSRMKEYDTRYDASKTDYMGQLKAAEMNYSGELQSRSEQNDIAKTNYLGQTDAAKTNWQNDQEIAREGRSFSNQQKLLDASWARWKKEQTEKAAHPEYENPYQNSPLSGTRTR